MEYGGCLFIGWDITDISRMHGEDGKFGDNLKWCLPSKI